jgi:hypothetical protein
MSRWKWIYHEGARLDSTGVNDDGTLHNPNGYPEPAVRAAIAAAKQRRHDRRSKAARKAAGTRRSRQDQRLYAAARRAAGEVFGPRLSRVICGRGLGDPDPIRRGIGSACWQLVLSSAERAAPGYSAESAP